jgi:hypothetical protein
MKASDQVGSYVKVYGYWTESTTLPNWKEARQLWEEKGRITHGRPSKEFGDAVVVTEGAKQEWKSSPCFDSFSALAAFLLVLLLAIIVAFVLVQWKAIRFSTVL